MTVVKLQQPCLVEEGNWGEKRKRLLLSSVIFILKRPQTISILAASDSK